MKDILDAENIKNYIMGINLAVALLLNNEDEEGEEDEEDD